MTTAAAPGPRTTYCDRAAWAIERFYVPDIQLVADYDGSIDAYRLTRALRLLLDLEPVLGCRREAPFLRGPLWRRIDDAALDARPLLFVRDQGESGRDEVIAPFLAEHFPATEGPQVRALLLRSPEGDRLVLKVNHGAADTGATKYIAERLTAIYRALGSDSHPDLAVNRGSRSLRQAYHGLSSKDLRRLLSRALRRRHRQSVTRVVRLDGDGPRVGRPRFVLRHLGPEKVSALRDFVHQRGATLNDLFVAAFLRVVAANVAEEVEGAEHRLTMTVDLRRYLRTPEPIGVANFSAFGYVDLGRELGADLEQTLELVKAQIDRGKVDALGLDEHLLIKLLESSTPFATFAAMIGGILAFQARHGTVANSFTNLGPIDLGRLGLGDLKATSAFIVTPASRPPMRVVGVSGDGERITFSGGVFESALPAARLEALFDSLEAELPLGGEFE